MANVSKEKRGATRAKLTMSATELFYSKGLSNTSIADISKVSGIPLGNIYYHFKTKDDLAEAVIASRIEELRITLEQAGCESQPLQRLKALLRFDTQDQINLVQHGCPYMSLIQDLDKLDSNLVASASELLELYLKYAESQFDALGLSDTRALALNFISQLQGAYLMARSLNSQEILQGQVNQIELWLEGLSS